MDSSLFFGGSLIAALVAGTIALFAPCCISVMLPAYFASSFQNRRVLVAMTLVFALGIATVVLPIALGASFLRQLITQEHTLIYVLGGLIMIGLAAYLFLGGSIHLPMPGRSAGTRSGPLGVYSLGLFSGVASSCCAPVLAGLVALAGMASSPSFALGLGGAYVFGMVIPLFVIALLWERRDWRKSRLFKPRTFTWQLGRLKRSVTGTNLASAVLLGLMGAVAIWIGFTQDAMSIGTSGWQANLTVILQAIGRQITSALSWIPDWLAGALLAGGAAFLLLRAYQQITAPEPTPHISAEAVAEKEPAVEYH
ncbi:MAG: cytochrome c biogenesis CcdA family protein [Deinococcus sp.]